MSINKLIDEIVPLYNYYKKNSNTISWTESLLIIWDIWEILKEYIEQNNLAPHNLYRLIYWKSEWSNNVSQKSYITRDFLSRSYRIRKIFQNKLEIQESFPNLKKFRLFYQAMPFIDNAKYNFENKEREQLFKLLNSNQSYKEIINEIYRLQKERIWIRNPRTQKLNELENEKIVFINFYNYLYKLQNKESKEIIFEINNLKINKDILKIIANNSIALSQDWLKTYSIPNFKISSDIWTDYIRILNDFITQTNATKIRRFRRLIPADRMLKLSDMLYKILSIIEIS